jgi:hypothetical protein
MLFSFDAKLAGQTRQATFNAGLVLLIKNQNIRNNYSNTRTILYSVKMHG